MAVVGVYINNNSEAATEEMLAPLTDIERRPLLIFEATFVSISLVISPANSYRNVSS